MIKPSLEEIKKVSKGYKVSPLALEIFSDQKTPIEVLKNLRIKSDMWFILESVNSGSSWGRYTFLGYKPVLSVYGKGKNTKVNGEDTEKDALYVIREWMSHYKSPSFPYLPPFTGGFAGYFSYDFVENFIADLELKARDEDGFRDFHLMLIDKVIAFDNFKQKIFIIVNIPVENLEDNYIKGITELKDIERLILGNASGDEQSFCGEFTSRFSKDSFKDMVENIKTHIANREILQAVVSNRFKAPFRGSLMNVYRLLRTINPSPYMVYMRLDDIEIACSSPETLVSVQNGEINSFPLAGTCPRGKTEEEDAAFINALLKDEKELNEHEMLVELAREDIGRISRSGSVSVRGYRKIKKFSHVSHISSNITGRLQEGLDSLDVIASTLPAGTLSGSPKKRACEIIDKYEGVKRGVYGGAIGYIDFTGNMDMCIGIRMAVLKDNHVTVQAGAGIVLESVAEKEYHETCNKAQALMQALINSN
ncbi:MAG: anthranilate synthase component I family protein [Treponema sp.]|nr:anthranilate synthase component I family protein [Treponema sp.]